MGSTTYYDGRVLIDISGLNFHAAVPDPNGRPTSPDFAWHFLNLTRHACLTPLPVPSKTKAEGKS
jgi:hypothetical protein